MKTIEGTVPNNEDTWLKFACCIFEPSYHVFFRDALSGKGDISARYIAELPMKETYKALIIFSVFMDRRAVRRFIAFCNGDGDYNADHIEPGEERDRIEHFAGLSCISHYGLDKGDVPERWDGLVSKALEIAEDSRKPCAEQYSPDLGCCAKWKLVRGGAA